MTETIKKKPDNKPDFSELDAESSLQDRQIMQLQTQLAEEKDLRKEERFVSGFIILIIFNIMLFNVIGGISAVTLSAFQLVLLIPIARKMGQQEISIIFNKVINAITMSLKD